MPKQYLGLPSPRPVSLALTPEETVRALVSDDDLARNALGYDVRHIVTFLTSNRDEQIEALNTLINAVEGDRISGQRFWDDDDDCGCAIGTICHAIGIDPETTMPVDHPHAITAHDSEDGDDHDYDYMLKWFEAIRKTRLVHTVGGEGRPDWLGDVVEPGMFIETLLSTPEADGAVHDALDNRDLMWVVRPGEAVQRVQTRRALELLAEVAHELLAELHAFPNEPLTPPYALPASVAE